MTPPVEAPARTDWVAVAREIGHRYRDASIAAERDGTPPVEELAELRESRLVNLLIPEEFGGEGGTWREAAAVVSELSALDPSLGALLNYHYVNFIPALLDYETDGEEVQRLSAASRWLWGNITQPWVPFRADPTPDGGFVLNGVKPFGTGVSLVDVNTVLAPRTDRPEFVYVYLPRDREGIGYAEDWDHFGLRRTETITATFTDVVVHPHEVLRDTHPGPRTTFPPLYLAPGALSFASILVGVARGALLAARAHVLDVTPAELAPDDVAEEFGGIAARVQASVALRDRVAGAVADAYDRRRDLTPQEISDLGIAAERLRVFAAEVALEAGREAFELAGPEALDQAAGLDRFWRDVRIHSLHVNPLIYTRRFLGDLYLNQAPLEGPPFLLP